MKKYYLAYGCNLYLDNLKRICPSVTLVKTSNIQNYALMFRGTGNCYAYLTPEKRSGSSFPLAILEIEEEDMRHLDLREGYPFLYDKEIWTINVDGKIISGIIYVMRDNYDYCMPSTDYMISCSKGYKSLGFDINTLVEAIMDTDRKMKENLQKK